MEYAPSKDRRRADCIHQMELVGIAGTAVAPPETHALLDSSDGRYLDVLHILHEAAVAELSEHICLRDDLQFRS